MCKVFLLVLIFLTVQLVSAKCKYATELTCLKAINCVWCVSDVNQCLRNKPCHANYNQTLAEKCRIFNYSNIQNGCYHYHTNRLGPYAFLIFAGGLLVMACVFLCGRLVYYILHLPEDPQQSQEYERL